MHLADGTTQYCSILAVYIDEVSVNDSITGDHTVRGSLVRFQIKISCAGCYLSADFNETVVIEQG